MARFPRHPAFIPYEGAEDTHDNRNKRQPEPIIWFEGTLISSPRQNRSAEDWLLETMAMGTATRKITIHASGREHSENIHDHARKGSRLMVKGTAGDEGSGIDIEATSLAFDPSHDEPDGNR